MSKRKMPPMSKVKTTCNSKECSFKPVKFNTFEYMYCSACKSEVTEQMVEYKARQKALLSNINPHIQNRREDEEEQYSLFDFWSSNS